MSRRSWKKVVELEEKLLLVGDNPFHGISHLSQERSKARISISENPDAAANLVCLALNNGANGFMFSVSETTLAILKKIREKGEISRLGLYAIVPYAYEYVRLATQTGGLVGLAKRFSKQLMASWNLGAIASGVKGVLGMDPEALLRTYLSYEISRIKSAAGKDARIESVLLHEVITDMALALNLDWLFHAYSRYLLKRDITPGFNTCNLPTLVTKFREWDMEVEETLVATPFNRVGFQMNPSREECEKTLGELRKPLVVAISMLAAGYLKLPEAADYLAGLPNVRGVAVGVSNDKHAKETFRILHEKFR
jgi:hypothetical protein